MTNDSLIEYLLTAKENTTKQLAVREGFYTRYVENPAYIALEKCIALLGDASSRKDEAVHNGGSPTIGGSPSEISVVDEERLRENLRDVAHNGWTARQVAISIDDAMMVFFGHLRTMKPVSVARTIDQMPPEGVRTKAEEWEAMYAALFRQMNELVAAKTDQPVEWSGNDNPWEKLLDERLRIVFAEKQMRYMSPEAIKDLVRPFLMQPLPMREISDERGIEEMAHKYWNDTNGWKANGEAWKHTREDNREYCREYVRKIYLPWVKSYLIAQTDIEGQS